MDRPNIFARKRATESLRTASVLFWLDIVGSVDRGAGATVGIDTDGIVKSPRPYVDSGKNSETLSPGFVMVFILGVINCGILGYNGKDRGIDCILECRLPILGSGAGKFVVLVANGNDSEADGNGFDCTN